MKRLFAVLTGLLLFAAVSHAGEFGTPDEAKAMADKAIATIKTKGTEVAYKQFNDPNDKEFHDRDMYIFVLTLDDKGTFKAHGSKPGLINKDMIDLKDINGFPLVKNFIETVKKSHEGWVDYMWPHPITKKSAPKSAFVKEVGDGTMVGVGVYKQ